MAGTFETVTSEATFANMVYRNLVPWDLGYQEISILKSMLVNIDFQTSHLIGWQHCRQPIRSHVRKSLLTNMEFNMDFT